MSKHQAKKCGHLIVLLGFCFFISPILAAELSNEKVPPIAPARSLQSGAQNSVVEAEIEKSAEPLNIIFLLDCSFSMKEKMKDQVQKIEAAKQVLQNALARIPGDVNIGLRVFGQGGSSIPGGECMETALLVPLGQGNRRSIIEQVRNIRAFGMTPLEYALRMTAEYDFAGARGNKVIILISDGADTCGGDPCRLIRMLPAYGIKIKVDVVGLDLKRDRFAREQLNCVAEQSGGKYSDANSASDLIDSVSASVSKAISGRILLKPSVPPAQNIQSP
jgi:Ca-activated chloride channel homolog